MNSKYYYNYRHEPQFLHQEDFATLRLHHNYNISTTIITEKKYGLQFVGPFKVLERVEHLIYRLDIPTKWKIYPVFTITQLEPCPDSKSDLYQRERPNEPPPVSIEGDTKDFKS